LPQQNTDWKIQKEKKCTSGSLEVGKSKSKVLVSHEGPPLASQWVRRQKGENAAQKGIGPASEDGALLA
jgi:hypothetical protein